MNHDRIATSASALTTLFDSLDGSTHVIPNGRDGRNWWWISQLLSEHPQVSAVSVVDGRRSRRLAEELSVQSGYGRAKNDRIDTEIMSIDRFDSQRHLISYSGLVPIEQESAGRRGVIQLNRHCNYYLKGAFVMAAHCARHHRKYRMKYQRDVKTGELCQRTGNFL